MTIQVKDINLHISKLEAEQHEKTDELATLNKIY